MTSGRPCQGWGRGSLSPPIYLSCLLSDFQNFFVWWKLVNIIIDFYSKGNLLSFTVWPLDVAEVTKVSRDNIFKWKNKFCNSWATYMLYSSKECIFYVEFKFKQKKYGSLLKNLKTFQFFLFWVKKEDDQVSSTANFSNIFIINLKNA